MPSTFTSNLNLENQATGENDTAWGVKLNSNFTTIDARLGSTFSTSMSDADFAATQANIAVSNLTVTGANTAARNFTIPAGIGGMWTFFNNTTGGFAVTVKNVGGTGITVANGARQTFNSDGTNCYPAATVGPEYVTLPTVGGTANAITLTYAQPPTALTAGMRLTFKATAANSGATTLTPNSGTITAKNVFVIVNGTPTALQKGEIANGAMVEVEYDGTQFQLLNPAPDEGSWTPVIGGASTAGTQTYANQIGRYIRIGDLVTVWGRITLSAKDAATSGNLQITGLPYTASNVSALFQPISVGFYSAFSLTASYTQMGGIVNVNTATILLFQSGSGQTGAQLTDPALQASSDLSFSATYRTA